MIIDGDGALFNNRFLTKGARGGAEAAHQLRSNIERYIQANCSTLDVESTRIIVCLIINMAGVASVYEKHGLLDTRHDFASFMRSFCVAQPLFSVVDVGHGKERADHKCRQLFDTMIRVPQCKHIIFGPCHDTGYVTVLESYRCYAPKITLFQTTPAHVGFRELGYKFASFKDVFRSEPLLDPNTIFEKSASFTTPSVSRYPTPITTQPKITWASSERGLISFSNPDAEVDAKPSVKTKYALLNALGQRIDETLPKWDYEDTLRFKQKIADNGKNFCNGYHLRDKCESTNNCAYIHGLRLSEGELLVLSHKARNLRCSARLLCEDISCPYGHTCPFVGRNCKYGDSCRFSDAHGIETVRHPVQPLSMDRLLAVCKYGANNSRQHPLRKLYASGHMENLSTQDLT